MNINADHHSLTKAKLTRDSVLGKSDASLAKKPLASTGPLHLDTEAFIAKLDQVAKVVDPDVLTPPAEQIKNPVLGTVRSWRSKENSPKANSPAIQKSKQLLRFCQEHGRFRFETEGQLLHYNGPFYKLEEENLKIFHLSSFFSVCFCIGIKTKKVDACEQLKLVPMLTDFTAGVDCLTGFAPLQPFALLANLSSPNQNSELKLHRKNGRTKQYRLV